MFKYVACLFYILFFTVSISVLYNLAYINHFYGDIVQDSSVLESIDLILLWYLCGSASLIS